MKDVLHIYLHTKITKGTKFQLNPYETVKKSSFHNLLQKCGYYGNALSNKHKNMSCTSKPQGHHVYQLSFVTHDNCGHNLLHKDFAIKCSYHGNALSNKQKKTCLAHLEFRVIMYTNFHMNCMKIGSSSTHKDFKIKCGYHANALSDKLKNMFCTSTPQGHYGYQLWFESQENSGLVPPTRFLQKCNRHGNAM